MTMDNSEFFKRIDDLADRAQRRGVVTKTGFLTPAEGYALRQYHPGSDLVLFGGQEGCERQVAFFLPEYMEPEAFDPAEHICAVRIEAHFGTPGHRDYLGADQGLGIRRESLGDLRLFDNLAYLFCLLPVQPLLLDSGSITVNGFQLETIKKRQIPYMRRTVGVIFQDFRLIENKTVFDNVAFGMRIVGASTKEIEARVPYVLDLVGLENRGRRLPHELSGGEQQRVAIARALVNNPSMVIADEPTGNLDPVKSYEIMMLLERINALGTTVMVVTHERELVNRFTKRVIAICDGRVINDGMDGYYLNEEN